MTLATQTQISSLNMISLANSVTVLCSNTRQFYLTIQLDPILSLSLFGSDEVVNSTII